MLTVDRIGDRHEDSCDTAGRAAETPVAPHHHPGPYRRPAPTFRQALGVGAERVIPAMDAAGDDVPYQVPEVALALPSVGLDRRHVPVIIDDPLGGGGTCQLSCQVQVRTAVPADRRGIHTSRIGTAVAGAAGRRHESLQAFAREVARRVDASEYGLGSTVGVSGVLSYLEDVPGWRQDKDKTSLEHLELSASCTVDANGTTERAGIAVNHITACPCVQQTYKHALLAARGDVRAALDTVSPLLTHSQRCRTRVELGRLTGLLPVRALLEAMDRSVYRVQNTLPREHELLLVYRAHAAPQFIEDAVRQVLSRVARTLGQQFPDASVHLESVSYESIHDYDIVADVELPMQALREAVGTAR